jgi:hypothetical protein
MNILIIRAFVRLRELLATHKDLARKIEKLEASQRLQALTQAEHGSILVAVVHPSLTLGSLTGLLAIR